MQTKAERSQIFPIHHFVVQIGLIVDADRLLGLTRGPAALSERETAVKKWKMAKTEPQRNEVGTDSERRVGETDGGNGQSNIKHGGERLRMCCTARHLVAGAGSSPP